MRGWLKQRGIQVLIIVSIYLLLSHWLPPLVHQALYTISVFIKDLLIWMLPMTVGLFIASAICSFRHQAALFIGFLILFEAVSNFCSVWYAFGAGQLLSDLLPAIEMPAEQIPFNALWRLPLMKPEWWSADKGTLFGVCLGCLVLFTKRERVQTLIEKGKAAAEWILTHIFSKLIPLFVLGFVARMYQTRVFDYVISQYGLIILGLIGFLLLYIVFLFLASSDGSWKGVLRNFKNLCPAGAIAFTSGCSLSTMPWTIEGTSRNLNNPLFAKAVIPATTNIQQIGDCIANTFLCFLIYIHFYGHHPDLMTWLHFSLVFVLARFATAAVMGGAIFIMLPIYENTLSFNAEMIALILAFNVILDPLITCCNVLANGALCRVFEKVWMTFFAPRNLP